MLYTTNDTDAYKLSKSNLSNPSFDLRIKSSITIKPYENRLISTGIRVKIPKGEVGMVLGKNATNREGILVFNTIYDSSYSGYIGIQCMNLTDEIINLPSGHPLAQLIFFDLGKDTNTIPKEISLKDFTQLF